MTLYHILIHLSSYIAQRKNQPEAGVACRSAVLDCYLFFYVFYVQAIRNLRQFLIQCPNRYTR
jgi:hypothetical protein